jgi:transposase
VPITGRNAKRVLFGAIDLQSARRVVLIRSHAGQADAQAFLRTLRRRYRRAGWLWLLTDRASAHTAPQTQALAARLRIRFVWLPRQAPELSPMDQLWRELKRLVAANRQAASIDALAADAAAWVLTLTPQQACRKAGMASKHFWLRKMLQNFWRPTYPDRFCQPMRPCSCILWRCRSRWVGRVSTVSLSTAVDRGGTITSASG